MAKAIKTKSKAKLKNTGDKAPSQPGDVAYEDKYKVEDGLRTLTRAEELKGDKALMDKIAAHAAEQAEVASRAKMMVQRGLISDKQAEKLTGKPTPDVNKAPKEESPAT